MDAHQFQAYVGLINQLLGCSQGQEGVLLQTNAELIDAGLLEAMEQYAAHLESQGNSDAGWLRGFAAQLKALGVATADATGKKDAKQFFRETLLLVAESNGNPQQVYPVWAEQQGRLNAELLAVIPAVGVQLLAGNAKQDDLLAGMFVNFGALIQQFPLGSRWLNTELGIAANELALKVYTSDMFPEKWAMVQSNLAICYKNRIRGDRAEDLEQAISAYESILQVYTRSAFPQEWAMVQNNLASAYNIRIRGDRAENLERAIIACELALQVRIRNLSPEKWALTQYNLANSYNDRIRGDRAENLEQAIRTYELVVQVYTRYAFPEKWAMTQHNLAVAYSKRIRGDRAENLEQAIRTYELALQVRTRYAFPEQWAETQHNLAIVYGDRVRGDRAENLEQAITAYELVLQIYTRDAFPEKWAGMQSNLANSYNDRVQGDRAENLEQAIAAYELALQIYTRDAFPEKWAGTQSNLAVAYSTRIRGDRVENLELSIAACELALEVRTLAAFPKECSQTARNLGNFYFKQRNWRSSLNAYTTALAAAETLYQSCILLDSKAAELAETAALPRRLAYALAQTGNLKKAVETLEQGRARGLSESLDRDRANLNQLQQLNPDLYNQYRNLTEQLRTLESQQRDRMTSTDRHSLTPEDLRETALALRQQLDQLIPEIRQVPGYESFLTLPTFEEVRQAAKSDKPLVYLVTTPDGSLALIVTPEEIQSIGLNDLNEQQLGEITLAWFTAYYQSQSDRQTWLTAIDSTTRQLWEPLMQPLTQHLSTHNIHQATLIPTGFLSLLPLHAAWTPDTKRPTDRHYALDDLHFTYAPNAKSLIAANAIAQTIHPTNIFAIDNPTQDLANSAREINAAIESFPDRTVLRHAEATVENVRSKLSEAAIVHFSCHGTANLNTPLNSGLLMIDGLLTLREILALNLAEKGGIRLAILSACETGLQGIENADEAISLPTGLLQAGVAGAIASLWSVSDLSTMLLLTKFYDLWRDHHLPPDQALRQAQTWLRDTTNREKLADFKSNSQNVDGLKTSSKNAEFLRNRIMDLDANRDDRSFAHPFHWADFYYTGV